MNAVDTTPANGGSERSGVRLLDTTDEIDAAWTESVLADSFPGASVRGVDLKPIGAGNVSDTVLVTIDYATRPASAPSAVVAKFRPSAPEVHEHGLSSGAYHREIGGYRMISEASACRIPRLYHVAGDETNINLVVEDLTGATPGNQAAGCSVRQAKAVLTQQARLHATLPMHPATAPDWPIKLPEVADYWTKAMIKGAAITRKSYLDRLSEEELAVVAEATEVAHNWHLLPQSRLSLTHGDPRVDNVLFEEVDGEVGAVLIDWQVTGVRNPMYDVGYFLSGSISVEDRRAAEDELLAHYVAEYDSISPRVYTLESAKEDYRTQVMSGLVISTAAIAVLPDVDVVRDLITALLKRNCAAVLDWGSIPATRDRSQS